MNDKIITAINEVNWEKTVFMLNTVGFLGYAMDEHNFTYDPRLKSNEVKAIRYSSILLAIAGVHYSILDVSNR